MTVWVVLLRGINLGGKRRIGMADLREALADAGFDDVSTHLQSGNVVLGSDLGETQIVKGVEDAIEARFGFPVPAVARDAAEMVRIASSHRFEDLGLQSRFLMVAFLATAPGEASKGLSDGEHAPDRLEVAGREVYLAYPRGQGRSKLSNDLIERRLGVTSTIRNWNTVTRLAEMVAES